MRVVKNVTIAALVAAIPALTACASAGAQSGPRLSTPADRYLPRAHSHNNYEQGRPLLDALERGFASIEVDIALMNGELYVTHDPEDIDRGATLEGLYLEPLREVARRNGGTVYGADRPPLQLLVDVKTDAEGTHAALSRVLHDYSDILTSWVDGARRSGPVSVVLSGNRAVETVTSASPRYMAIDGRVLDDREGMSPEAMPLVSADWEKLGPPDRELRLASARRVVEQMHAEGREVRFWATPEDEDLWASLVAMGVDYIGTDDPSRLERFIRDSAPPASDARED